MAIELPKYMVEVYDLATGEHYEREANAEELAFYKQLESEQADDASEPS